MKKFELTDETTTVNMVNEKGERTHTVTLYRIKALKDFYDVKAGDLGGYVESEYNLSQDGMCWIYDNAHVFGNAVVAEGAAVYDDAEVCGDAQIFGCAKIREDAAVCDKAIVCDNAVISGNAVVCGTAEIDGEEELYIGVFDE